MKTFLINLRLFLFMTILTGVIYPLTITGAGQILMNHQAQGSLIKNNGHVVGSEWIGQNFTEQKYFWSRPSATDYNPQPSGGSNLSLTSQALHDKFLERIKKYDGEATHPEKIPADLLFASASGLDPHISPAAARFQIKRVATARNLSETEIHQLENLVAENIRKRDFGILGEETVNVLLLNLEIDRAF